MVRETKKEEMKKADPLARIKKVNGKAQRELALRKLAKKCKAKDGK